VVGAGDEDSPGPQDVPRCGGEQSWRNPGAVDQQDEATGGHRSSQPAGVSADPDSGSEIEPLDCSSTTPFHVP
jgi:hypothetical protein